MVRLAGRGTGKKLKRARLRRQWQTIDRHLQNWLDAEDRDGEDTGEDTEDAEDDILAWGELLRPESSLHLYKMCAAFDMQHLPWPGGLLNQADWWIHDVMKIAARKGWLRQKRDASKATAERLERVKRLLERKKRQRS